MKAIQNPNLYESVRNVLDIAHRNVYSAVNSKMVTAYWEIGRLIVEEEQNGTVRADYGKQVLKELSGKLTVEFGRGYSIANLRNFRQFYLVFPEICNPLSGTDSKLPIRQTLSSELSWSHFCLLIRVENQVAREFYMKEASQQNWSVRALDRQISTLYYERIISSSDKTPVKEEAENSILALAESPRDFIKDYQNINFIFLLKRNLKLKSNAIGFTLKISFRNNLQNIKQNDKWKIHN